MKCLDKLSEWITRSECDVASLASHVRILPNRKALEVELTRCPALQCMLLLEKLTSGTCF